MKTKAVILLLPFVMFITETVSFPLQSTSTPKKVICMKMVQKMKCHHQKGSCSKPADNSNSNNPGNCSNKSVCSFCPMFALFVMQPQYVLTQKYNLRQNQYPSLENGYISSYTSDAWKPPNKYLLS